MKLIIRKLSYLLVMLIIISLISFLVINLAPSSFFASGSLNPNITPEATENLKRVYGLDKSLYERYFLWLIAIFKLDFGISFISGESVSSEILRRVPITLTINAISMILVFFISIYIGVNSALNIGSKKDKFFKYLSIVSFAMPSFYLALILIIVFALNLELVPLSGISSSANLSGISKIIDTAWHLVLPIFIIVFGGIGSLSMYIRSLTIEILKSDYMFYARARNLTNKQIKKHYIYKNLYPPIITLLGLSLPAMIGGSVILETIFSIDGMGLLFYNSALSHDYPVIMGILIIGSFLTLLGNIIADLILLRLNPYQT